MTVPSDLSHSSPTLSERWIKANVAAAMIAGLASVAVYSVKNGMGATAGQADSGALLVLYFAATVLYGVSGTAGGLFTGAVLQRVVRRLPVRTWIVLHALMSIFSGLAVEMMDQSRTDRANDAAALDPGVLPSSIIFGAAIGTIAGGLEALVLKPVAEGLGAWIKWSATGYAAAWMLLVSGTALLQPDAGFTGELLNEALSFAAALIIGLLTLPALAALQPRSS